MKSCGVRVPVRVGVTLSSLSTSHHPCLPPLVARGRVRVRVGFQRVRSRVRSRVRVGVRAGFHVYFHFLLDRLAEGQA